MCRLYEGYARRMQVWVLCSVFTGPVRNGMTGLAVPSIWVPLRSWVFISPDAT